MKITHLGHSCVLVESAGARILIDPGAFTQGFEQLTDLDAVLVTHQHNDHLDIERLPLLLEANEQATLLTEPETAAELGKAGIEAEPLQIGETVPVGQVLITGIGGMHASIHPDIPRIGNAGLLLTADGEPTFFHPGDSYEGVPEGVDVLALPLTAPWAKISETADFVRAVRPGRFFPIHEALLKPTGRSFYLGVLGRLLPEGTESLDLADAGPTDF